MSKYDSEKITQEQLLELAQLSDLVYDRNFRESEACHQLEERGYQLILTSKEFFDARFVDRAQSSDTQRHLQETLNTIDLTNQTAAAAAFEGLASNMNVAASEAYTHGYFGAFFYHEKHGYCPLVNRGTRPSLAGMQDLPTDIKLGLNHDDPALRKSIEFAARCKVIATELGASITTTGHSLGKFISDLQAILLDLKSVGFDGPFLNDKFLAHYDTCLDDIDPGNFMSVQSNPHFINGTNNDVSYGDIWYVDAIGTTKGQESIDPISNLLVAHSLKKIIEGIEQGRLSDTPTTYDILPPSLSAYSMSGLPYPTPSTEPSTSDADAQPESTDGPSADADDTAEPSTSDADAQPERADADAPSAPRAYIVRPKPKGLGKISFSGGIMPDGIRLGMRSTDNAMGIDIGVNVEVSGINELVTEWGNAVLGHSIGSNEETLNGKRYKYDIRSTGKGLKRLLGKYYKVVVKNKATGKEITHYFKLKKVNPNHKKNREAINKALREALSRALVHDYKTDLKHDLDHFTQDYGAAIETKDYAKAEALTNTFGQKYPNFNADNHTTYTHAMALDSKIARLETYHNKPFCAYDDYQHMLALVADIKAGDINAMLALFRENTDTTKPRPESENTTSDDTPLEEEQALTTDEDVLQWCEQVLAAPVLAYTNRVPTLSLFTQKFSAIISDQAQRYGDPTVTWLGDTLSTLNTWAPFALPLAVQAPYAFYHDQAFALKGAYINNFNEHLSKIFNPFDNPDNFVSFCNFGLNIASSSFGLSSETYTPLSEQFPGIFDKAALTVKVGGVFVGTVSAYQYNKPIPLFVYDTLADAGVSAFEKTVGLRSDGNLPENPGYYYVKDYGKTLAVSWVGFANPAVGAYLLCNSLGIVYDCFTYGYEEKAYAAMLNNAEYYFKKEKPDTAKQSLTKLRGYMNRNHGGVHYSNADSAVVKQAKITLYCDEINNLYQQENYTAIMRETNIELKDKTYRIKTRLFPTKDVRHAIYIRLLTAPNLSKFKNFRDNYKRFHTLLEQNEKRTCCDHYRRSLANAACVAANNHDCNTFESHLAELEKPLSYQPDWRIALPARTLHALGASYLQLGRPIDVITFFDEIPPVDRHYDIWNTTVLAVTQIKQTLESHDDHILFNKLIRLLLNQCRESLDADDTRINTINTLDEALMRDGGAAFDVNDPDAIELTLDEKLWPQLSIILERQRLFARTHNEEIEFNPMLMPLDGDCMLHALGLKRETVIQQLLLFKNDHETVTCGLSFINSNGQLHRRTESWRWSRNNSDTYKLGEWLEETHARDITSLEIRRMMSYDILSDLLTTEASLPEALLDITLPLLARYHAQDITHEELLEALCDEQIYELYVSLHLSKPGLWMQFSPQQEGTPTALTAIALLNKLHIVIWQRARTHTATLVRISGAERPENPEFEITHIMHTNADHGQLAAQQNHFNRLDFVASHPIEQTIATNVARLFSLQRGPHVATLTPELCTFFRIPASDDADSGPTFRAP